MRKIPLIAALSLLIAVPAAADSGRYVAPGGAFSIVAGEAHASGETATGNVIVVNFPRANGAGLATQWGHTVEWVKLDKPVDPADNDAQAAALVDGYLNARFGAGAFTVGGRGKFRDDSGAEVYVFSAQGSLNGAAAGWQGVVLFFDSGVALVSNVAPQDEMTASSRNGIVADSLVGWAKTLRPRG